MGPWLQRISDVVFKHKSFIKKIPEPDRPDYVMDLIYRPGAKYGISDFTAYESHFTPKLFRLQSILYHHMMSRIPGGRQIVNEYISVVSGTTKHNLDLNGARLSEPEFTSWYESAKNVCQGKFVTVIVKGKRLSGEMDTSLGNGVVNWTLFECCKSLLQVEGEIVVEGDDGLFRIDGVHFPTNELYHALGFIIDIIIVDDISKASFCGMLFDPSERVIITDPRKVMARIGIFPEKYHNARWTKKLALLRARGFSLVYQYGSCPIIGSIGRKILELTRSVDMRGFLEDRFHAVNSYERELYQRALSSEPKRAPPGDQTRLLVQELYGISVQEQIDIEHYYDNLESLVPNIDVVDMLRPDFFDPSWIQYAHHYACYNNDRTPVIPLSRHAATWDDIKVVEDDGEIKPVCPARGIPLDTTDLASLGPLRLVVERSLVADC